MDGAVSTPILCKAPAIDRPPLLGDCRLQTQRVAIHANRVVFNPAAITGGRSLCGRMAVRSNFGTEPRWSPYQGDRVQRAITFEQQNSWHHNTYVRRSNSTTFDPSGRMAQDEWQSAPLQR